MAQVVMAIDQGTTSTRAILFNHQGMIVSSAQKEHHQFYPKPGWVEHDPLEIWRSAQMVMQEALISSGLSINDVAVIGITNQRETTLVWDKSTGKPFYPAVVWQDTRTDQICSQLAEDGGQDRFRRKTGLPIATYFSGPKIKWLLENVPGLRQATNEGQALFGNIDTWILWNLTGGVNGGLHLTDVTNASRTLLMNLETLDWDDEIITSLGIPRQLLPEIKPSSGILGFATGAWESIPVAGILVISKQHYLGKLVLKLEKRKIHTALAVLC